MAVKLVELRIMIRKLPAVAVVAAAMMMMIEVIVFQFLMDPYQAEHIWDYIFQFVYSFS